MNQTTSCVLSVQLHSSHSGLHLYVEPSTGSCLIPNLPFFSGSVLFTTFCFHPFSAYSPVRTNVAFSVNLNRLTLKPSSAQQ